MINLYIAIPSLEGGGSERVIITLIKHLDKKKFNITLLLGSKTGKYVKEIPDFIDVIDLKKQRVRQAIFSIIKIIRKDKPDVVLSTLGHLNLMIALFRYFLPKETKFIARESNTISIRNKDESYPKLFDFLFKTIYKRFDFVICQANSMRKDLLINFGFPEEKMTVINNPVDFKKVKNSINEKNNYVFPKNKYNILIIGRFTNQKRIDHAIKIMKYLSSDYYLSIFGDGELRSSLKELVSSLELEEKISIEKFCKNPYTLYNKADLLISTSKYEGFPNVVLEANACGLPVLSYNYIGGIDEIIIEGYNGCLIENGDIKAFSKQIEKVRTYSFNKDNIINLTKERFNVSKIVRMYEKTILKIVGDI
jgi:glycosyltransferase involved in cell wall biosynthesis